jgi:hypothetical protein
MLLNWFYVECADGLCPPDSRQDAPGRDLLGERMGGYFFLITLSRKGHAKMLKEYADNFDPKPGWSFSPANLRRSRIASRLGYVDCIPQ